MEDTLTVPRLKSLKAEWERTPPVPLLLAAWLGVKRETVGTQQELIDRLQSVNQHN